MRGVLTGNGRDGTSVVGGGRGAYLSVFLFPRTAGQSVGQAFGESSCAGAAQGEAIGFTRNRRGYVTVSEGVHPALHQFVAP